MSEKNTILGAGNKAVAGEYLVHIQEFASERGVPPQVVLKDSGLPLSVLVQPDVKIGHLAMDQVVRNILDYLDTPSSLLALEYGKRLTIAQHGVLGMAAQNCQTLAEAAQLLVKYVDTRAEGEEFDLVLDERYAHLRLPVNNHELEESVARFHVLSTFINLESIARRLAGKMDEHVPVELLLAHPCEADVDMASELLSPGLSIRFSQMVNELCIPIEYIMQPLPHANPELASVAQAMCEEELLKLNINTDIAAMVRLQIRDVEGRLPTIDQVAQNLHMSARTLKRKLNEKGTSYQHIKDSERFRKAIHLLETTRDSMERIAERLGYSNASNFNKAFKSWADMSPSEYRQRLLETL